MYSPSYDAPAVLTPQFRFSADGSGPGRGVSGVCLSDSFWKSGWWSRRPFRTASFLLTGFGPSRWVRGDVWRTGVLEWTKGGAVCSLLPY